MGVVDDLMTRAFPPGRPPRSVQYRAGMRSLLARKFLGTPIPSMFDPGTVEFDAFHAGIDEGHAIYREYKERSAAGSGS